LCQRFADECESRARQRGRDDGEARKLKRPSLRPALIVRSRAAAAFDSGRPSNEAESRTVRRRQYLFHRESIIRSKSGLETFAPDYTADDDVITVPNSTTLPCANERLEWISAPREDTLRIQASLQLAPVRSRAGSRTRRRSSRGLWLRRGESMPALMFGKIAKPLSFHPKWTRLTGQ